MGEKNVSMENEIDKKEIIEKLKKYGESLSEVAKKNKINLAKLGD